MTTLTAEESKWIGDQTMAVLAYATRGGLDCYEGIVEVLGAVGDRYGDRGTFAIACSIAAAIAHLDGHQVAPSEGFYGFEVQNILTGEIIAPEQAQGGEDLMAGMRFLTAYINYDPAQLNALFHSTPGPVFFGLCMLAGAIIRHKKEEAS